MGTHEKHQPLEQAKTDIAVLQAEFHQLREQIVKHEDDDSQKFNVIFKKLDKIEARLNMGIGAIMAIQIIIGLVKH